MKYWRGYLTAAIIAAITIAIMKLGEKFGAIVDMIYPYVVRTLQDMLAAWSGSVSFCLWQMVLLAIIVVVLATLVLALIFKWNLIQWFGWVLTGAASIFLCHTLIYGINYYAGPLSDDIRMEMREGYTAEELADAAIYYRDKANELANTVDRNADGTPKFPDFDTLAAQAGNGFDSLVYEYTFPTFAGTNQAVKKLGWADLYTSMGITGVTMGLTGEAAVNPQIPAVSLPFTMAHEMCHRKCIASERDANFGAFLACMANDSIEYQYSGYFMAYRYCYNALASAGTNEAAAAAARVASGENEKLKADMAAYSQFFAENRDDTATAVANAANDTYLKTSGEESGIASYGEVADLLYSWYYQQEVLPSITVVEDPFDPFDETQVDLSGIVNAKPQAEEPAA